MTPDRIPFPFPSKTCWCIQQANLVSRAWDSRFDSAPKAHLMTNIQQGPWTPAAVQDYCLTSLWSCSSLSTIQICPSHSAPGTDGEQQTVDSVVLSYLPLGSEPVVVCGTLTLDGGRGGGWGMEMGTTLKLLPIPAMVRVAGRLHLESHPCLHSPLVALPG